VRTGLPDVTTWQELINDAMSGSAPTPQTSEDEMRACTDDDGGVYVFGPGVFEHVDGEQWGAWERFTGPALRINNRQRDLIRDTCLAAGAAPWASLLRSGIDSNQYAAGDILSSAEKNAHDAAEHTATR
jgi:hypothetical protein